MIEIDGKMYNTAIVHDWVCNYGGAERVLERLLQIMPGSPVYIGCYMEKQLSSTLRETDLRPSFLQKKQNQKRDNHQIFLPFMPLAFEEFDLNEYDIVVSDSSCCAKGVITNPTTMHICYCHTPMRYAYEFYYEYTKSMNPIKKKLVKYLMNYLRVWDVVSANRVDYFVANSENVANRIRKHYAREASVIYPPVNISYFFPQDKDENYYLCVSRIIKHKRIDLVVNAFNRLGLTLYVIGEGEELKHLRKMAESNVHLLGRQPDSVVKEYYCKCKAFIFPTEEDFGITPIESQACGRPVIAYAKGGALETVIDGVTGVLFKEQSVESLIEAIQKFEKMKIAKGSCRKNAERFSNERYDVEMKRFIEEKWREYANIRKLS